MVSPLIFEKSPLLPEPRKHADREEQRSVPSPDFIYGSGRAGGVCQCRTGQSDGEVKMASWSRKMADCYCHRDCAGQLVLEELYVGGVWD